MKKITKISGYITVSKVIIILIILDIVLAWPINAIYNLLWFRLGITNNLASAVFDSFVGTMLVLATFVLAIFGLFNIGEIKKMNDKQVSNIDEIKKIRDELQREINKVNELPTLLMRRMDIKIWYHLLLSATTFENAQEYTDKLQEQYQTGLVDVEKIAQKLYSLCEPIDIIQPVSPNHGMNKVFVIQKSPSLTFVNSAKYWLDKVINELQESDKHRQVVAQAHVQLFELKRRYKEDGYNPTELMEHLRQAFRHSDGNLYELLEAQIDIETKTSVISYNYPKSRLSSLVDLLNLLPDNSSELLQLLGITPLDEKEYGEVLLKDACDAHKFIDTFLGKHDNKWESYHFACYSDKGSVNSVQELLDCGDEGIIAIYHAANPEQHIKKPLVDAKQLNNECIEMIKQYNPHKRCNRDKPW